MKIRFNTKWMPIIFLLIALKIFSGNTTDLNLIRNERISADVCPDQTSDLCFFNGTKKDQRFYELKNNFNNYYSCSCDFSCHNYGDCCVDIPEVTTTYGHECVRIDEMFGIFAIVECPNEWDLSVAFKKDIKNKCESIETYSKENLHLFDVPVYSGSSGKFYRNLFCSICNDDIGLVPGTTELECLYWPQKGRLNRRKIASSIQNKIQNISYYDVDKRSWIFNLGENNYRCFYTTDEYEYYTLRKKYKARLCKPAISSCIDGWDDDVVAQKCHRYTAYLYNQEGKSKILYKNYHCAICNNATQYLTCPDDENQKEMRSGLNQPLSITMSFGDFNGELLTVESSSCLKDQYYDSVSEQCITLYCGYLYKWSEDGRSCVKKSVVDVVSADGFLLTECPKLFIGKSKYTLMNELGTLYINQTRRVYLNHEYEPKSIHGNSTEAGILICIPESFLVIPLDQSEDDHLNIQVILTEISLLLSIFCLIIHLVTYLAIPKLRNLPGKNLMSLSFAVLMAHTMFLVSGYTKPNQNFRCIASALLTHYYFLVSFFWMNIMSFDVWSTFTSITYSKNLATGSKIFYKYSIYSWVIPAIIVAISWSTDHFLDEKSPFKPRYGHYVCWINQRNALLLYFLIPLAIILTINLVLFSMTIREIMKTTQQAKRAVKNKSSVKNRFFLYLKLALIMGMTWIFGFIAAIAGYKVLWYPFIIFNGLQGVFIFFGFTFKFKIYYMLIRKDLKDSSSLTFSSRKSRTTNLSSSYNNDTRLATQV